MAFFISPNNPKFWWRDFTRRLSLLILTCYWSTILYLPVHYQSITKYYPSTIPTLLESITILLDSNIPLALSIHYHSKGCLVIINWSKDTILVESCWCYTHYYTLWSVSVSGLLNNWLQTQINIKPSIIDGFRPEEKFLFMYIYILQV